MSQPNQILVAIDFSDCADEVVAAARQRALESKAAVTLLHVVSLPAGLDPGARIRPEPGAEPVAGDAYVEEAAGAELERFKQPFDGDDLEVSTLVMRGPVVDSILAAVDQVGADLVYTGTHDRTGFYKWMLGSVAAAVTKRAAVPVVTVHPVHRPSCEAKSCSACQSGGLEAEEQVRCELEG